MVERSSWYFQHSPAHQQHKEHVSSTQQVQTAFTHPSSKSCFSFSLLCGPAPQSSLQSVTTISRHHSSHSHDTTPCTQFIAHPFRRCPFATAITHDLERLQLPVSPAVLVTPSYQKGISPQGTPPNPLMPSTLQSTPPSRCVQISLTTIHGPSYIIIPPIAQYPQGSSLARSHLTCPHQDTPLQRACKNSAPT